MIPKLIASLTIACTVILSPLAAAEQREGQDADDPKRAHHMQKRFGVTDEQLAQMRRIRENGGSREDMRAVLSDEQRAQMRDWREQHHRGHGHRRGGEGNAKQS